MKVIVIVILIVVNSYIHIKQNANDEETTLSNMQRKHHISWDQMGICL